MYNQKFDLALSFLNFNHYFQLTQVHHYQNNENILKLANQFHLKHYNRFKNNYYFIN